MVAQNVRKVLNQTRHIFQCGAQFYSSSSWLWKMYRKVVFILLFVFGSLVVKQRMKVATNLQEIVTVAGFQPSKNFTAYFWTIALIYVLPLPW